MLARRVEQEAAEFERGVARVATIQGMHARMLRNQKLELATEAVAGDVEAMQLQATRRLFNLGAKKAFAGLFERLRERLNTAQHQGAEAVDLLEGSFSQLNSEFGFSLALPPAPDVAAGLSQLDLIEQNYAHYLGLGNALKLSDGRFMEQFRRMLLAKLNAIFEAASSDVETWHRSAATQLESQLRDRRESFERRHEALSRVATAQDGLEARIGDLEEQDKRLQALALHTRELTQSMRRAAAQVPRELAAGGSATTATGHDQDTVPSGLVQAATTHGATHVDTVAMPLRD
jgi:hypothetical protein